MTPASIAERLLPKKVEREPFPHFVNDGALPDDLAESLLCWMEATQSWRLHTASFFEQYELDLIATSVPSDCSIIFAPETLSAIVKRYAALFGQRMTGQARVTAHKLICGQTIGIHTDQPRSDRETHRLLVHLNRGWSEKVGGELILLNGNNIDMLHSVIAPFHNRSIGFEMSEHSYHAVAKVNNWTRYTLIFSFWAEVESPTRKITEHALMPQRDRILEFLNDFTTTAPPHSNSTFLNHLKGVERILDRWGASLETRLAGLMHSIYGTEGFPAFAEVNRAKVRELIGQKASRLIELFCAMDQKSLMESIVTGQPLLRTGNGEPLESTPDQIEELLLIYLANIAEQLPRLYHMDEVVADDHITYQQLRSYVPQSVRIELDTLFNRLDNNSASSEFENSLEALRTFISEAGGDDVLYGRTTMLNYLSTMEALLAKRGAKLELRLGALAHGLYGWKADLSERNRATIRLVAGHTAERLAWLFACMDDLTLARAAEAIGTHDNVMLELKFVANRQELITRDELAALQLLASAAKEAV